MNRDEMAYEYAQSCHVVREDTAEVRRLSYAYIAGHASRDAEVAELWKNLTGITNELHAVQGERDEWKARAIKNADHVIEEMNIVRAQLEAMMPVIKAARQIIRYENHQEDRMDTIALDKALRAYDATKEGQSNE